MDKRKALVVYYSRTGNTKRIAAELAERLGCDIEEIIDERSRNGPFGYIRSGFDAFFERVTPLREPLHDPAAYDLVIIGTPIWNASLSAPVRNYLARMRGRIDSAALFLTCGGMGGRRVLRQMSDLLRQPPVATLCLTERDLDSAEYRHKLDAFVQLLPATASTPSPLSYAKTG